jgi:hypothetical protein
MGEHTMTKAGHLKQEILEFHAGNTPLLILLGTVFLCLGYFLGETAWVLFKQRQHLDPAIVTLFFFGGVCWLLALIFLAQRSGFIIDRDRRQVTKWSGLPGFSANRISPLGAVTCVSLVRAVKDERQQSYFRYRVDLVGHSGILESVDEFHFYFGAKSLAERVAKFLDVGLSDASTGLPIYRDPGTLDLSFQDFRKRQGGDVDVPDRPTGCKILVSADAGSQATVFDFPQSRLDEEMVPYLVFLTVLAFVLPGFLWPIFQGIFDRIYSGGWGILVPVFYRGIFLLIPISYYFYRKFGNGRITLTRDRLSVLSQGYFWHSTKDFPLSELEELFLESEGGGMVLRSDKAMAVVGIGLGLLDLQWLEASLSEMLLHPEKIGSVPEGN